jgi:hypothetical protein
MNSGQKTDFFMSEYGNTWAEKDIMSVLLKRYPRKIAPLLEKAYDLSMKTRGLPRRIRKLSANVPAKNILVAGVEMPGHQADMQRIRAALTQTRHRVTFDTVVSSGKGKFENINDILSKHRISEFDWVVITDDDIAFPENFMDEFVFLSEHYNFKIAQPAHNFVSYTTFSVTRRHWNSIARITNYVEIGPIFILHRDVFSKTMPFPEASMGWGIDISWSMLARELGWRIGIIDALPIRHLRPVGKNYDCIAARNAANELLEKYDNIVREDILKTVKTLGSLGNTEILA